jgi:hypothetical protein
MWGRFEVMHVAVNFLSLASEERQNIVDIQLHILVADTYLHPGCHFYCGCFIISYTIKC